MPGWEDIAAVSAIALLALWVFLDAIPGNEGTTVDT